MSWSLFGVWCGVFGCLLFLGLRGGWGQIDFGGRRRFQRRSSFGGRDFRCRLFREGFFRWGFWCRRWSCRTWASRLLLVGEDDLIRLNKEAKVCIAFKVANALN